MRESAENYLETILLLEKSLKIVRSIDIAHATGFSKPSISVAMKKLKSGGFIEIHSNGEIFLTEAGRNQAKEIFERHTILVQAFTIFGISKEIAELDACKVEHIIHKETFQKIKDFVEKHTKIY